MNNSNITDIINKSVLISKEWVTGSIKTPVDFEEEEKEA